MNNISMIKIYEKLCANAMMNILYLHNYINIKYRMICGNRTREAQFFEFFLKVHLLRLDFSEKDYSAYSLIESIETWNKYVKFIHAQIIVPFAHTNQTILFLSISEYNIHGE